MGKSFEERLTPAGETVLSSLLLARDAEEVSSFTAGFTRGYSLGAAEGRHLARAESPALVNTERIARLERKIIGLRASRFGSCLFAFVSGFFCGAFIMWLAVAP